MTETKWPVKSKIFTLWPFTEKKIASDVENLKESTNKLLELRSK